MGLRYDTISFLSDYGLDDEFVGVVKSVVRSVAPEVRVIDVTHAIAPHDVRAGGLALARSAQYLAPGVVLAVVDPGVATSRKAVAIEVGGGQAVLVGPDNGLLAPAVAMVGGADRAVELTNTDLQLPAPGPTFAGRDIFAPAAAHLCAGVPLTELGDLLDTALLVPGMMPLPRVEDGALIAEVLWVDRFGNAQLNVDPDELDAYGPACSVLIGSRSRLARRAVSYSELGPGSLGLIIDSYGLIALALDRASAADELGVAAGDQVVISAAEGDGGVETSVTLGETRRPS